MLSVNSPSPLLYLARERHDGTAEGANGGGAGGAGGGGGSDGAGGAGGAATCRRRRVWIRASH